MFFLKDFNPFAGIGAKSVEQNPLFDIKIHFWFNWHTFATIVQDGFL